VVKGQGHSVRTSSDRRSIAWEIGVAEWCNVRISTGSWQIAVCAHAQYRFGQKSQNDLWRRGAWPRVAMLPQNFATLIVITLRASYANERSRYCFSLYVCVSVRAKLKTRLSRKWCNLFGICVILVRKVITFRWHLTSTFDFERYKLTAARVCVLPV